MKIEFKENTVYHTETQEEFDFILKEMKNKNLSTCGFYWNNHKEETCINVLGDSFADIGYYINEGGFKIIEVKELIEGGGLIKRDYIQCFNSNHMQGCIDRLREYGYAVYKNSYGSDFDNGYDKLIWDKNHFVPTSSSNVGRELFLSKLPALNKLPAINGYQGELLEYYIKYGCAKLPLSWFKNPYNRRIKSMVLSSGIVIHEEEMNKIREFLDK